MQKNKVLKIRTLRGGCGLTKIVGLRPTSSRVELTQTPYNNQRLLRGLFSLIRSIKQACFASSQK